MSVYFTLNIKGDLKEFPTPVVMGIINVTPDSFYCNSRSTGVDDAVARAGGMLADGASILDVGGCSTRPGSEPVPEDVELERVIPAVAAIRAHYPDAVISVDTFRGKVARKAIEAGADIINDISGGTADPDILRAAVELKVPYVLTHPAVSSLTPDTPLDQTVSVVLLDLQRTLRSLRRQGLCDVIIDPGFGFGKTLEQNYRLMAHLDAFACLGCPILVGVSRKSMITRVIDAAPHSSEALTGTAVLNGYALQHGAAILRVHDVSTAVETLKIINHLTV